MEKISIQLSKRLQAVAAMVPKCGCVADIGCDHGYMSIFLVQQGIAPRAIAMDVGEGPLERAREHIVERHLESYIQVRLSDGLEQLIFGEADAVVIAGMGGAAMEKILKAGEALLTKEVTLVLQPQSEIPKFRSFLWREGYRMISEDIVLEDGKYYPMMQVRRIGDQGHNVGKADTDCPYTAEELAFGPVLLERRHPVLHQYLCWRQQQVRRILEQIRQHAAEEIRLRRTKELRQELESIQRALDRYHT